MHVQLCVSQPVGEIAASYSLNHEGVVDHIHNLAILVRNIESNCSLVASSDECFRLSFVERLEDVIAFNCGSRAVLPHQHGHVAKLVCALDSDTSTAETFSLDVACHQVPWHVDYKINCKRDYSDPVFPVCGNVLVFGVHLVVAFAQVQACAMVVPWWTQEKILVVFEVTFNLGHLMSQASALVVQNLMQWIGALVGLQVNVRQFMFEDVDDGVEPQGSHPFCPVDGVSGKDADVLRFLLSTALHVQLRYLYLGRYLS